MVNKIILIGNVGSQPENNNNVVKPSETVNKEPENNELNSGGLPF